MSPVSGELRSEPLKSNDSGTSALWPKVKGTAWDWANMGAVVGVRVDGSGSGCD